MQWNGQHFKNKRQQLGLSQQTVADLVGISKGYVCDIENGKKQNISPPVYKKLLEVLELKELVHTESYQLLKLQAESAAGLVDPKTTITKLTDLLQILPPTSDLIPELSFLLAKLYYHENELGKSQTYVKLAYDHVRGSGNYLFENRCFLLLALIDTRKGSNHSALERLLLVEGSVLTKQVPPAFSSLLYSLITILNGRLNRVNQIQTYMEKAKTALSNIPDVVSDLEANKLHVRNLYRYGSELETNGAFMDASQLFQDCIHFKKLVEDFELSHILQLEMAYSILQRNYVAEAKQMLLAMQERLETCNATHTHLYYRMLLVLSEVLIIEKEYTTASVYADSVYQVMNNQSHALTAMALRNKAMVLLERDHDSVSYKELMTKAISILRNAHESEASDGFFSEVMLKYKFQQEYLTKFATSGIGM
jgi:transcriptional regulator with XRE-family HTH domain